MALSDILIIAALVVVAAILGLVVHPLLWFIILVAVAWLILGRRRHSRL